LVAFLDDRKVATSVLHRPPPWPAEVHARVVELLQSPHRLEFSSRALAVSQHVDGTIARLIAARPAFGPRIALAKNPRTPVDVLELLALDPDRRVRAATASAPALSEASFRRLATDAAAFVRVAVVECDRCPDELVAAATFDGDRAVADAAYRRARERRGGLKAPSDWVDDLAASPLALHPALARRVAELCVSPDAAQVAFALVGGSSMSVADVVATANDVASHPSGC
jgi:hypothetical protein